MMRKQTLTNAALFTGLLLFALPAGLSQPPAAHTNFTGTWKLDNTHSDFGRFPGPARLIDNIVQSGSEIVINRDRDGEHVVIHVPLDGSLRENKVRVGMVKTRAHWEGATLVIEYTGLKGKSGVKAEERWTLTPRKTTIKVIRNLIAAKGESQQTLTMVKAGA